MFSGPVSNYRICKKWRDHVLWLLVPEAQSSNSDRICAKEYKVEFYVLDLQMSFPFITAFHPIKFSLMIYKPGA